MNKKINIKKIFNLSILTLFLFIFVTGCSFEKWQNDLVKEDVQKELSMSKVLDQSKDVEVKPSESEYLLFKKEDIVNGNEVITSIIKKSVKDDKSEVIYKLKSDVTDFTYIDSVPVLIFDNKIMVERSLKEDDTILIDSVGNEVFSEALEYKKNYPWGLLSNNGEKYAYYDKVTLKEIYPEINIIDLVAHTTNSVKIEPSPGKMEEIILDSFSASDSFLGVIIKSENNYKYVNIDLKQSKSVEILADQPEDILQATVINNELFWLGVFDEQTYFWKKGLAETNSMQIVLEGEDENAKLIKSNQSVYLESNSNIWREEHNILNKVVENATLLDVEREDKFLVFAKIANFKKETSFNVLDEKTGESREIYNTGIDLEPSQSRISYLGIIYEK